MGPVALLLIVIEDSGNSSVGVLGPGRATGAGARVDRRTGVDCWYKSLLGLVGIS